MKKKIIKTTARVISKPSRVKSAIRGAKADAQRAIIVKARAYDNAPDFVNGKPTDAFKVRSLAADIKAKKRK
jgi:hypothetical protein